MIIRTGYGLGQLDMSQVSSDPFANISSGLSTAFSDLTAQWGIEEWAILIGGAIVLVMLVTGTSRTVGATREAVRSRRTRRAKRKRLKEELAAL